MRKTISLISIWVATCLMLLSTIVMHHHHYESVCIVVEHCQDDAASSSADTYSQNANEAEEGHSHQESDRGSCRLHQLHRFIINAKVSNDIHRHIIGGMMLATTLPLHMGHLPFGSSYTITKWQHTTTPLHDVALCSLSRRGPPSCSL